MGKLFKPQTETTKSPFESNPWKPQQEFIKKGFQAGSNALDNALDINSGVKDYTANLTQDQQRLIDGIKSHGTGAAMDASRAALGVGNANLGVADQFGSNAAAIYADAGQNRTDAVLNDAHKFADDPYLQGQIDAALGDVRKAFDRDVGDINAAATGSGNINSTRAGALEAIALDDAMDRAADISSSMRGQAYQAGIDRSMAMDDATFARRLAANGMIADAGAFGLGATGQGLQFGSAGLNDALAAESIRQEQAQREIDGQRQMSREELDLISRYMAAIGGNYGQSGYQTHISESPSIFNQIAGAALTYAGLKKT